MITFPSLIASHIKGFLERESFIVDRESECQGFHTTANGSRLQMIDPTGQVYEVLVNPIRKEAPAQ